MITFLAPDAASAPAPCLCLCSYWHQSGSEQHQSCSLQKCKTSSNLLHKTHKMMMVSTVEYSNSSSTLQWKIIWIPTITLHSWRHSTVVASVFIHRHVGPGFKFLVRQDLFMIMWLKGWLTPTKWEAGNALEVRWPVTLTTSVLKCHCGPAKQVQHKMWNTHEMCMFTVFLHGMHSLVGFPDKSSAGPKPWDDPLHATWEPLQLSCRFKRY